MTAEDLGAAGAMTVLLKDAIKPNLIQTLEGQPCLMHAGPFANIAHGNSSLIADLLGLKLGRVRGHRVRVRLRHGDGEVHRHRLPQPAASRRARSWSSPPCARSSTTAGSTDDPRASRAQRLAAIEARDREPPPPPRDRARVRPPGGGRGQPPPGGHRRGGRAGDPARDRGGAFAAAVSDGFAQGGKGVANLAEAVVAACEQPNEFRFLYEDEASIKEKIETIAGAGLRRLGGRLLPRGRAQDRAVHRPGTRRAARFAWRRPRSRSPRIPQLLGAPTDFQLPVRDVRAYTGAGWLVPLCGDVQQMPGLGKSAAAFGVDIDADGRTVGLF